MTIVALDLGGEIGVEEGCRGRKGNEGRMGDGIGEIGTDLGDESAGDGKAVKDGGDEGDGAAEGMS